MNLKVVVTGTGRCGTNYMANVLTSLGLHCGHEAVFDISGWERAEEIIRGDRRPENSDISKDGEILSDESRIEGDSSYAAAPFLDRVDSTVIHLVRNPISVVASMTGSGFRNFAEPFPVNYEDMPDHFAHESFIFRHVPDLCNDMPQIDRACLFYLRWNEMIEGCGKVAIRHRVEDSPEAVKKLLGLSGEHYANRACNSFSRTSRPWGLSDISSRSLARRMRDVMRAYGYPIPD